MVSTSEGSTSVESPATDEVSIIIAHSMMCRPHIICHSQVQNDAELAATKAELAAVKAASAEQVSIAVPHWYRTICTVHV